MGSKEVDVSDSVGDGDGAPDVLREHAEKLKTKSE